MDLTKYIIEFLPGVWLSNTMSLNDNFIKQKKIITFIDCEKDLNFFDTAENYIESIKNEIKKESHKKLYQYLLYSSELIHKHILSGKSILIYDQHATKKGPILLIVYLMRYGNMNPEQIIESFMSKSKIPLNISHDYQLGIKLFYSKLKDIL